MKLWEGRFTQPLAKSADDFNQSLSFDYKLYWHDILASIAHVKMLGETQIIPKENAEKIKNSLVQKGVFELFDDPSGKEVISYSDAAISWLDDDFLIDTIRFNFKNNESEYTVMFCLRRTGITAMFDRGTDVRIMSTNQIPWEFYMR